MRRHISGLIWLIICITPSWGQAERFVDALKENPARAASNYQSYEFVDTELTPAPKGYKPVYISHYSRHGSRYHTGESYFKLCMPFMKECENQGLLSEAGKEWYKDALTVYDEHKGMFGMLTALGSKEQEGLGNRITERFPEVFSGKNGRTEVRNRCTRVQRSIVSMTSFNTVVAQHSPSLHFSYAAGDKFRAYLNCDPENYPALDKFDDQVEDSLKHLINTSRMFQVLFNDPEAAARIIDNPYNFSKGVLLVSAISPNTDAHPDMFKHFHPDDILGHWIIRNNIFYAGWANSAEMASEVATIARPLIHDIVIKAEEALGENSTLAADFRFGHDTGLLPLVATIGINGMHEKWSAFEAHEYWSSSEFIPMASSLQMVFYQNKKGEVLVKLLYNEKETSIPALKPTSGPYYSWSSLKDYLLSL